MIHRVRRKLVVLTIVAIVSIVIFCILVRAHPEDSPSGHPHVQNRYYGAYVPDSNELKVVILSLEWTDGRIDSGVVYQEGELWVLTKNQGSQPTNWLLERRRPEGVDVIPLQALSPEELPFPIVDVP